MAINFPKETFALSIFGRARSFPSILSNISQENIKVACSLRNVMEINAKYLCITKR